METIINFLYNITNDLGLTIIVLTLLAKVLLLPLSLKAKKSSAKQMKITKEMDEVKIKYKKNKIKREKELERLQSESVKQAGGCLLMFIQLPIISLLYSGINSMSLDGGSLFLPWVTSLKAPDPYFIIPIIYIIISILSLVIRSLQNKKSKIFTLPNLLPVALTVFITLNLPSALGIYFIISSLFTIIEEHLFNFHIKKINFCNF